MSDIFTRMSDLSLSLHVNTINILNCYEKANAIHNKLSQWCWRVKRGNYSSFQSLVEIVDDNDSSSLIPNVCEKLWLILKWCRHHLINILA